MNELDLIKEVEKWPILYDKTVTGFAKHKLREEAWSGVSDSLNVSDSECKKRWRSLRDSFIKLQRTHGGRTRWPYHQAMRFLLPHIEIRQDHSVSSKREKFDRIEKRNESEDSDAEEDVMRLRQIQTLPTSLPDLSFSEDMKFGSKFEHEDDHETHPSAKKARINSTDEDNSCQHCNRTDPDELFLLSCASSLRRLTPKQNSVVRLKIQQILYEAEFGHQMELPYVTPASDCGFDNLDGGGVE